MTNLNISQEELQAVLTDPAFATAVGACLMHAVTHDRGGSFTLQRTAGNIEIATPNLPMDTSKNNDRDPYNHAAIHNAETSVASFHSHPHYDTLHHIDQSMPSQDDVRNMIAINREQDYILGIIHSPVIGSVFQEEGVLRGVLNLFRSDTTRQRKPSARRPEHLLRASMLGKVPGYLRTLGVSHQQLGLTVKDGKASIDDIQPLTVGGNALDGLFFGP